MKRIALLLLLVFVPRAVPAEAFDVTPLLGEWWYGLYMNGKKAGFGHNIVRKDPEGKVVVVDDAKFRVTMVGVNQDMAVYSERTYAPDGSLLHIVSHVQDPAGKSDFNARVEGDKILIESIAGGAKREATLPKPAESLADALKFARWAESHPAVGDKLTFTEFEPMYQKEITGTSEILRVEDQMYEGAKTKIYRIRTTMDIMGIATESVVTENGTLLEDTIAGMIVMRLEPEAIAKDVQYSNDVIVSNAAMVDTAIENPRTRESLALRLRGPMEKDHVFSDERQTIAPDGDAFKFTSRKESVDKLAPLKVPIDNPETKAWREATAFVQSDQPRLIAKAKEILNGETDALKISNKLCAWVYANVRSTFSARLTNALEVLDHLEGDCTEHSILFIGLARAAGLPAREVAGLIYVDSPKPGFYFHQWAEVWVGKWLDVDPTFDQPIADVTHIKLVEGDPFQQARIIPMIGNLKIEVIEDAGKPAKGEVK